MDERVSVVLIEDRAEVAALVAAELRGAAGIDLAAEARSGREGLELVAEHDPGLVLLDLGLPDMEGLDVLRELLESGPERRVVVLTGHVNVDLIGAARDAGARGFLDKGVIGSPELTAAIRAVAAGESWFPGGI